MVRLYSAALEWRFECRIKTPSYSLLQHCLAAPLALHLSRLPLWSRTSIPSFPQPLPTVRAAWTPTLCCHPSSMGPAPTTSGHTSMGRLTQVCQPTVSKLGLLGVCVMQQWWGVERTQACGHVNTENIHTHAHMHSHTQGIYGCMHAHTHECMHACVHTHTHAHMRTHTHAQTHTQNYSPNPPEGQTNAAKGFPIDWLITLNLPQATRTRPLNPTEMKTFSAWTPHHGHRQTEAQWAWVRARPAEWTAWTAGCRSLPCTMPRRCPLCMKTPYWVSALQSTSLCLGKAQK